MVNKTKDKFLIIGYGKFGEGFAKRLLEEGVKENKIYIIDRSEESVGRAALIFSNVNFANVEDFERLNLIDIQDIDIIVIAMADIEESLMIASNRRKYHDKYFYAKAKNEMHKKLLKTLGIDEVVIPEQEIGSKLAYKSLFKNDVEISDISSNFNIIHFKITKSTLLGKSISSINIKDKFNCIIFGIKRNNIFFIPNAKEILTLSDILSIVCQKDDSKKVLEFFNN